MKRVIKAIENRPDGQFIEMSCGHTLFKRSAKWFVGDEHHCPHCLENSPLIKSTVLDIKSSYPNPIYYRIRATEILPFHQVGKREPLVRYYLENIIKGGMKFADKRDAQDIVDALDHEQLTAVTFLIKFRHEVVEVADDQN